VGYDRIFTPADFSEITAAGEELSPGAIDWDNARHRPDPIFADRSSPAPAMTSLAAG
jgi:hypothetical protein